MDGLAESLPDKKIKVVRHLTSNISEDYPAVFKVAIKASLEQIVNGLQTRWNFV